MDPNKIFSLFSKSENLDGVNDQVYIDFTQTPIYWIGMYRKIILNRINFRKKAKQFLESIDEIDFQVEESDRAGDFIAFERAYNYIKNLDLNNNSHLKDLKMYSDIYFECTLQLGLNFFEENEDYEKCIVLRNVFNTLKSFRK